jgi:hypothetical protein
MTDFFNLELSFNRSTLSGCNILIKTHEKSFALVQELRPMNDEEGGMMIEVAQTHDSSFV